MVNQESTPEALGYLRDRITVMETKLHYTDEALKEFRLQFKEDNNKMSSKIDDLLKLVAELKESSDQNKGAFAVGRMVITGGLSLIAGTIGALANAWLGKH